MRRHDELGVVCVATPVKTGLTDNGRVEVTAGLSEETPVLASSKGVPSPRTAVQPQLVRENS